MLPNGIAPSLLADGGHEGLHQTLILGAAPAVDERLRHASHQGLQLEGTCHLEARLSGAGQG